MARSGGEADKIGNRYEAAWTIRHALRCLVEPSTSLTVEDIDEERAIGAEFTFESPTGIEVHQLKRQNASANHWSIKALHGLKVWNAAKAHVSAGRTYRFVSLIPCGNLPELADRARRSADLEVFTKSWRTNDELIKGFDELASKEILGSPETAWNTLRGMHFEVHDERDIIQVNALLAALTLDGATGHLAALALGDTLLNNLAVRFDRKLLLAEIAPHGLTPKKTQARSDALEQVRSVAESWRESVARELIQPAIDRQEASDLCDALTESRVVLLTGAAGGGKSATLEQAIRKLQDQGHLVLAFRLDRVREFASTHELGTKLGLQSSPASALALAAAQRPTVLVIDQLDAVSLASGRLPENFDTVADLIREASAISDMRVVVACRQFDVDNDHRIREFSSRPAVSNVHVADLSDDAVDTAVTHMGLDATQLSNSQRRLLRVPLHLVLLQSVADNARALDFTSRTTLFDAFWERKFQDSRNRKPDIRFNQTIGRVATAISDRQTLSVPKGVLDLDDLAADADVLVSEHVLARDGQHIAFFHEAFFDYSFARQWLSQHSLGLTDFLAQDEQELFRRGQVRQILHHLREQDATQFRTEIINLLSSPKVRYHLKDVVLALVGLLETPGPDDADALLDLSDSHPGLKDRLWQQLRTPAWFSRFNADGWLEQWLSSNNENLRERALNLMSAGTRGHVEQVVTLLDSHREHPEYGSWLKWIARYADVHENRRLFEMVLAAVSRDEFGAEHDLWLSVRDLAKAKPLWAIELLVSHLDEPAGDLITDEDGKVARLRMRDYGARELVHEAAARAPLAFCQAIIPYLLKVMSATASDRDHYGPIRDNHFGFRFRDDDDSELGDALFYASRDALVDLAAEVTPAVTDLMRLLSEDEHEGAQYLLYCGLTAAGADLANWSATLLLHGGDRLVCGLYTDSTWTARQLVAAISPVIDDDTHLRLEEMFRDLRMPWDSNFRPRRAFQFLSALDEARLSELGRRRLNEYRRLMGEDQPAPPQGVTGGFVGSPIPVAAAEKMNDGQWLKAMSKYDSDTTNYDTMTGGARELAHLLGERVKLSPVRFARLTKLMTPELHPAYANAMLIAFGEAIIDRDDRAEVFDAVRRIASFGHTESDQWIGVGLRRLLKHAPIDIVELVLDRALNAPDPENDRPVFTQEGNGGRTRGYELHLNAINTSRGSLAEVLGDLLVYDVGGERTALVAPHLMRLARDHVLSVRTTVAHVLAAALRHARSKAVEAFHALIDADDILLAADLVQSLVIYIGNLDPASVAPVIDRMLNSEDSETCEAGGGLAAFAGLEWGQTELLAHAMSGNAASRTGVARTCAHRLDRTSDAILAKQTLSDLMHDEADCVRAAVAEVAARLRGQNLRPFAELLENLIKSDSYTQSTPQIFLTLEHAPDRVDDLVLAAARRFIEVFRDDAADIRNGAAGDAHYVSELVVRGLAQVSRKQLRSELLDVLDELLRAGVYGIQSAIGEYERE